MAQVAETWSAAPKVKVGVVQANIGIVQKGRPGLAQEHLALHQRESQRLVARGAELLVWPESSYPYAIERERTHDFPPENPRQVMRGIKVPLLFGVLTYSQREEYPYNSAYMMEPDGRITGRFDKNFLLVFGEYIPFYDTFPSFRKWFPAANRPGYHVIRPDSHWFLEQHLPFDYSSQAMVPTAEDKAQFGLQGGRLGDWRRAPANWQPYHPAPDDYQVPGTCRRWIARCLNVGTRFRLLVEHDVRQAFREAEEGRPSILAFTNHDFRDMRPDVDGVLGLLSKVSRDFPRVPFKFAEAVEAMRGALALPEEPPCRLDLTVTPVGNSSHVLEVRSEVPTFGPQPWLALKAPSGEYFHDNFDIEVPFHRWQYVFDDDTYPLKSLEALGVAANNATGVTTVAVLDPSTGKISHQHWNR